MRTKPAAAGEVETKKEATAFREVKCLLLSYQNILKIDNLVGFDKLIKLQLDNNIIEKIENLGHLVNLEVRAPRPCDSCSRPTLAAALSRGNSAAVPGGTYSGCWLPTSTPGFVAATDDRGEHTQASPAYLSAAVLHVRALQALDLSFNNISEISGLDTLTNLTTLSLFSNRITQVRLQGPELRVQGFKGPRVRVQGPGTKGLTVGPRARAQRPGPKGQGPGLVSGLVSGARLKSNHASLLGRKGGGRAL